MSLFCHTENYELSLPMDYDTAFETIKKAAISFGKITNENKTLGILQFKKGVSLLSLKNPVSFSVNFNHEDPQNTKLKIIANSNDGALGLNSVNRTYNDFLKLLSEQTK